MALYAHFRICRTGSRARGCRLRLTPTHKRLITHWTDYARKLRNWLDDRGYEAIISPNTIPKNPHAYNQVAYRSRNLIERLLCRLKNFRSVATH